MLDRLLAGDRAQLPAGRVSEDEIRKTAQAVWRAVQLYEDPLLMDELRRKMMRLDFSWEKSMQQYLDLYASL